MYNSPMFQPPPHQPLRCCGCIPLKMGSLIICFIWAAFSMYLAVLSFQNTSLFYSYLPSAAITVYGVVNLILSLVSVAGLAVLVADVGRHVRTISHAVFVCVFLVLVDGFVNIILFITNKTNFYNWCVSTSSQTIIENVNASGTNTTLAGFDFANSDYYNCHNLWEDELKFGIIFYILMFAFYVYWALTIYSFSLLRRSYHTDADLRDGNIPMGPGGGLAMPPPAMINNGGVAGAGGPFPPDRSVIVLNNQKPRSKSTKKKDTFSFRNIKKSIVPSSSITPMQENHQLQVPFGGTTRRDSQFTIGFRLGPDGNIVDIENAPSPTPTFINNGSAFFENQHLINNKQQQQQLKRKSISSKDDHYSNHKKRYYDDEDEGYY